MKRAMRLRLRVKNGCPFLGDVLARGKGTLVTFLSLPLLCSSAGLAADPIPTGQDRAPAVELTATDGRLLLNSLQALAQDAALAPLHLGVSVQDHVVTVWGPVPSAELARRAEVRIRQVLGVADVVNELIVVPAGETMIDPSDLASADPPTPSAPVVREQAPPLPGALAGLAGLQGPTSGQGLSWQPAGKALAAVRTDREQPPDMKTFEVRDRPSSLRETVDLGPPVAIPGLAAAVVYKVPVVLLPPVTDTQATDLGRAIERLRQKDRRFLPIRPEITGGTVHLRTTPDLGEDLMALAQEVSRLPGVERILLETGTCVAAP